MQEHAILQSEELSDTIAIIKDPKLGVNRRFLSTLPFLKRWGLEVRWSDVVKDSLVEKIDERNVKMLLANYEANSHLLN